MNPITAHEAERLLSGIVIPPRPTVVQAILEEKSRELPDLGHISQLIAGDVALAAAVLKTVNSPLYGLRRRVSAIDQAVGMLGMTNIATLVTGIALPVCRRKISIASGTAPPAPLGCAFTLLASSAASHRAMPIYLACFAIVAFHS